MVVSIMEVFCFIENTVLNALLNIGKNAPQDAHSCAWKSVAYTTVLGARVRKWTLYLKSHAFSNMVTRVCNPALSVSSKRSNTGLSISNTPTTLPF